MHPNVALRSWVACSLIRLANHAAAIKLELDVALPVRCDQ